MPNRAIVHVIDDDASLRESLGFLLEVRGYEVRLHESGDAFLEVDLNCDEGRDRCILTDVRMPGLDGLSLMRCLGEEADAPPVIIMTGHADVALAVAAVRAGALDVLEKPFDNGHLFDAITAALEASNAGRRGPETDRLKTLSKREREVLRSIASGNPNQVTARELGISPRTVEVYRAKLMAKAGVHTMAELMRMAVAAGL